MRSRSPSTIAVCVAVLLGVAGALAATIATRSGDETPAMVTIAAGPAHAAATAAVVPAAAPTAPAPVAEQPTASVSAARMIGQKLMVGFRQQATPPRALLRAVRAGRVGGVIMFGENDGAGRGVAWIVAQLQRAARAGRNPPLLISIDQEGGVVRRLADAPPTLSPRQMGARGAVESRRQGRATGAALRRRGINVDLAPVVDVPVAGSSSFLGDRTFGTIPARVAATASAFAAGLQEAGVAATAKHYPGLGTTGRQNTDEAVVRVGTSAAELTRRGRPFRRLAAGGVRLVMVSNAIYTALDPDAPAVLSRRIVAGLRSFFGGVIVSDALEVPALRRHGSRVATLASNAGVDVLLYTATNAGGAYDAMLAAHARGDLSPARLRASYERIMSLKGAVATG